MGRGGAKGRERASLPPDHWTYTDPDRHLWTPSQLAQARQVPSRAAWDLMYGGALPVRRIAGVFSRANRHLLLPYAGAYESFADALEGQRGVVHLEIEESGVVISDLEMHSRGEEGERPFFEINGAQMDSLATLLEKNFHCQTNLCWSDIWIEGRDLQGGGGVARFDKDPHAIKVVEDTVANLGAGQGVILDQPGHLLLHRTGDEHYSIEFLQDPFALPKKRLPESFSTARGIIEKITGTVRGARSPLLPRQVRRFGEAMLVEIGSRGSSKLFARSAGFWGEQIFQIEDPAGAVVLGRWDQGMLRLWSEEWPLRLSGNESKLLSQWIRSREKLY